MLRLDRRRRLGPDRAGMTMVEMIVAMAIFAVITSVVIGFLTGSRQTYSATSDRAITQQSLRAVFSLMTREIRSAGCDPLEAGIEGITVADDLVLRCRMDLTGDGSTLGTAPDEDITYTYVPALGELHRTTGGFSQAILRNLTLVQFTYFDATGAALVNTPLDPDDRARVRFVDITIDGELRNGEPVSYSTRVFVRNG